MEIKEVIQSRILRTIAVGILFLIGICFTHNFNRWYRHQMMLMEAMSVLHNNHDLPSSESNRLEEKIHMAQYLMKDDLPFQVHLYLTIFYWLMVGCMTTLIFNKRYLNFLKNSNRKGIANC